MKLLIGGSPCTYWSIAQTKNRETEASGMGWELFKNYVIARDKFQPDYFLYENNKSMSPKIKEQITEMLGVETVLINSALVSAQNRQRLYWVGKREADGSYSTVPIEQPEDRGILLRDVLESGVCWREKGYTIDANGQIGFDTQAGRRKMVAEPVGVMENGKAYVLRANYSKAAPSQMVQGGEHYPAPGVAEPMRIGTIESNTKNGAWDSKQYRVYSPDGKSTTLCGEGGGLGAKTGLYATPVCMRYERSEEAKRVRKQYEAHDLKHGYHELSELHPRTDGKSNTLSTVLKDNPICETVVFMDNDGLHAISPADGKTYPVYEVRGGKITIKGKQYPIKLSDGCYIIRKLTVTECKRLQTVPESYVFPVSDSQSYKMLGNGWTVDVIAHIMAHMDGITTEPLDVLSMYDGMACGHIALDKLGAKIRRYVATEIDKYAIKTATHNFPDIIELGDAFKIRG